MSFLAGLLAMARFSHRQGSRVLTATNRLGALVVAFTLIVNLRPRLPPPSLAGTVIIVGVL